MCVKMAPRRRAAARSRPPPLELWLWQCGSLDELHLSTSAARARAPVRWGALGGAGDIGAGGGGAAAGARRRALVYAYIDPSRVFGSLGLAVVTALLHWLSAFFYAPESIYMRPCTFLLCVRY